MMNGLTVSDLNNNSELNDETNQLIKLIEDFEIVENNEPNMNGDLEEVDEEGYTQDNEENIHDITNNVEGYVTSNKSFGGYVVWLRNYGRCILYKIKLYNVYNAYICTILLNYYQKSFPSFFII